MKVSMIAAMANNRVIGADNAMPWHLPADLKHFKAVTMGKPVIMGRKTYESIGRALPGRLNIVISSQPDYVLNDATVVATTDAALDIAKAQKTEEVMIIGGGTIYHAYLALATTLYLTFIDLDVEGDTQFPAYQDSATWQEVDRIDNQPDDKNPYSYSFVTLTR